MVTNREISDLLDEFGRILEIKEANIFKIRAYQSAARTVQSLSSNLNNIYRDGGIEALQGIDGIGKTISKTIVEYLETGNIEGLEKLKREIPDGLLELIKIEGLGPKSINKLNKELGIKSVEQLEKVAKAGKLRGISGFGKKTEANIIEGIDLYRRSTSRRLRMNVLEEVEFFIKSIRKEFEIIERLEIAGSYRRKRSTIGDIDVLVQAPSEMVEAIMTFITSMNKVARTIVSGMRKTSILTDSDLQFDFRIIESPSEYAAHLQYFTGSKEHNIKVRQLAMSQNLSLNEYGLKQENGEYLSIETEKGIYNRLGLQFVPPELREDRGEVELAKTNELPKLLSIHAVKSDLHLHTLWSEGNNTIEEMALEAKKIGLHYIVVTDHTKDLVIANGMDEEKVIEQITKIRVVNSKINDFEIFSGAELNIKDNGEVDLSEEILNKLDFAIASIHSGFKQSSKKITERITTAMTYDKVKVLAHPTGRQLNKRDPYSLDLDKVIDQAIQETVALEINGSQRQDLDDITLHSLRDNEVKFSLGSDAHSREQYKNLEYAVDLARKGWIHPNRVINTLNVDEFKSNFIN